MTATLTDYRPLDLYTAAEAARRFGIPPGSIRAWKTLGKLWDRGRDDRGRLLYERDDLIALRDNTQRRTTRGKRKRSPRVDPNRWTL